MSLLCAERRVVQHKRARNSNFYYSPFQYCTPYLIISEQSHFQAIDWDDRMKTVKWVDVNGRLATREEGLSSGQKVASDLGRERATKKRIYETEPEPAHTVIEDSARTLSLAVSAKVDYATCECSVNLIHFKDTLMFQTRIYR